MPTDTNVGLKSDLQSDLQRESHRHLEWTVLALVGVAFLNIYLTQPVLRVLESEFHASVLAVSFSVSAVLAGIAFANLPFGWLADRWPVQRLVLLGGGVIALAGLVCAFTRSLEVLIAARFVQGCFVPALTSCLAAHLARHLPPARLNVAMGGYVAATVLGGMASRLLGGWAVAPTHWRGAFLLAAGATLVAVALGLRALHAAPAPARAHRDAVGFARLLREPVLWLATACGAAGQAVFSPMFNYMPYRLAEAPFLLDTRQTSLVYLVYLVGIVMGPGAGRLANRHGAGRTLVGGASVLMLSLLLLLAPSVVAVVLALVGVCGGFFTVHASAVGLLNRRLTLGQGRANGLYVLGYYLGAWFGISWAGFVYQRWQWPGVVMGCLLLALVPLTAGVLVRRWEGPPPSAATASADD